MVYISEGNYTGRWDHILKCCDLRKGRSYGKRKKEIQLDAECCDIFHRNDTALIRRTDSGRHYRRYGGWNHDYHQGSVRNIYDAGRQHRQRFAAVHDGPGCADMYKLSAAAWYVACVPALVPLSKEPPHLSDHWEEVDWQ